MNLFSRRRNNLVNFFAVGRNLLMNLFTKRVLLMNLYMRRLLLVHFFTRTNFSQGRLAPFGFLMPVGIFRHFESTGKFLCDSEQEP